ncbi:hypothetical protein [Photobacterium leiognathi]|uniref:hypothetical protein n=1 Tax=Photobacterium leiognathi TaxID=553611 RepID=UPI002982450A|nr:hypothetical protein [Photobacterium leiognathi]
MKNSAVVTKWGVDAFDCLIARLHPNLSVELVSRIESFISSYVLYDYVYLNENYKDNKLIKSLNASLPNVIKFISTDELMHSDDMRNHISIDPSLYHESFSELSKNNNSWLYQNDPQLGDDMFFSKKNIPDEFKDPEFNYTKIRLWMWCLTNEMAELKNSVSVLPLSMNDISNYSLDSQDSEFIINRYAQYKEFHTKRMFKFTESSVDKFWAELSNVPPLFLLYLNYCSSGHDEVSALINLRKDYSDFRSVRAKYSDALNLADNINDREIIVDEWNKSWEELLQGEFKEPKSVKNTLTSTDISSILVSPESGLVKSIIKCYLDNKSYKKSYNTLRVFSDMNRDIGSMKNEASLLKSVFDVGSIVPFKKI